MIEGAAGVAAGEPAAVVAAVAGAEGGEPAPARIPKEEERKVEHVLEHIDRIRKLERDAEKVRETLGAKKLSEVKRKELRNEIKAIEAEMMENLEAIQLNKKQIDRIVLKLKGFIKRVEEAERELLDCERRSGVAVKDLRRLLREAREDEGERKRLAKRLHVPVEEVEDLDRTVRTAARKILRVQEEARRPGGRAAPHLPDDQRRRAQRRAGQDRAGGGQPPAGGLHRQEVHQPRPAVPRPDPGGEHRPHEGGGQVRVQARVQVLDLRHLVDSPGHHPGHRRPGPHHPHPGAHDRDHQQAHPDQPLPGPGAGSRADARRRSPRRWSSRSTRSARSSRSPRSPSRWRPPSARRRTATSATSSRTSRWSRPPTRSST